MSAVCADETLLSKPKKVESAMGSEIFVLLTDFTVHICIQVLVPVSKKKPTTSDKTKLQKRPTKKSRPPRDCLSRRVLFKGFCFRNLMDVNDKLCYLSLVEIPFVSNNWQKTIKQDSTSDDAGREGKIAYTVYGRLGKTIMAKKINGHFFSAIMDCLGLQWPLLRVRYLIAAIMDGNQW
jgi:hypothetical protein